MTKERGIKKLTVMLFVSFMMLFMAVSAEAAFSATTTNVNYPSALGVGQTYIIGGKVTANAKITKATVGVCDSTGTKYQIKYTEYPNAATFMVSNADAGMVFNTLKTGEYYYRIEVYNAAGTKVVVLNKKFTVGSPSTVKPTITKTGLSKPTTINQGSEFIMKGTIKANFSMKSIAFNICNSKGTSLQRYEAQVNGTSYNVNKADPYLRFDTLKAGTYIYRITVYDTLGKRYRIEDKTFTVKTVSSIKITSPVPASNVSITAGSEYGIGGTITSTHNLTSVTGIIYNGYGNIVYRKVVNPNTKTYKLAKSAIDNALYFEKLSAGVYTVQVSAVNSAGKAETLIEKIITVKKNDGSVTPVTPTDKGGIQIVYPVPSTDISINYRSVYNIGGVIVSKYQMDKISIALKNAAGNYVTLKSINPASRVYIVDNGALDAAIEFETLPKGTYTLILAARDKYSNVVTLMKRKVVVK